jgi:hypothetical protein
VRTGFLSDVRSPVKLPQSRVPGNAESVPELTFAKQHFAQRLEYHPLGSKRERSMGKFDGRIDAVFADMAIPQWPGGRSS